MGKTAGCHLHAEVAVITGESSAAARGRWPFRDVPVGGARLAPSASFTANETLSS
jgi:hypothetical protein